MLVSVFTGNYISQYALNIYILKVKNSTEMAKSLTTHFTYNI